jgi:glutathione S-transferase
MKIYGDVASGNCYKIKLVASLLDIKHEWVHVDIINGGTSTQEFLLKNPNGKVPVLALEDGRFLSESNAIINYLGGNSDFVPNDNFTHAKVLQWQFFEQYSHEPYIAVARFIAKFQGIPEGRKAEYDSKQIGGHKALKLMEQQLALTSFLVGDTLTVADISLYAYTHVASEGGFDLSLYPNIRRWLDSISQHPKYVGMGP